MTISRREVLVGAGAISALALSPGGVTAPRAPWQLPAKRPVKVTEHEWIPLPDGVRLSARLWLPEDAATKPVPVVLEYIPYRKRDGYRYVDDLWGPQLASYGIGYARVDVRGSGDSEGVMVDEYSEAELGDGVACIEWLSRQPWCTGAVGMRGISWGGINTLQVAARAPRALKAIMPMGCCDNRFTDDAHYVGGALGHTNYQWGILFKIVMAGPPDPDITGEAWEAEWRARLAATPPILETWTRHQRFDAYWQRGSVVLDYAAIKCPTYIVDGWQDTYANPVGRLLSKLNVPRKGLIGPWGHTYPAFAQPLGLDWAYEEVRWWDHWLNGVETGIMDEPQFRAFMPYSTARQALPNEIPGRWIAEQTWPPRTHVVGYHLNDGALSATRGPRKDLRYRAGEIVGLTKPEWLDRLPIEQSSDDLKSLTFDSEPLAGNLEILGYPVARIRVSADAPVAKLVVRVTEVTADGKSWLVTYGLKNLTHRTSDSEPAALVPGESYDVEIPLFMTAYRFNKGSKIRVAISENLWPLAWPSPTIVTLTVTAGASMLMLPVRPPERHPAEMPIPVLHHEAAKEAPPTYQPVVPDASGRYVIEINRPPLSREVAGVGTTVSREVGEVSEIVRGDPNSCRWRQHAQSAWKRGSWDCTVAATCEITSTATTFHVRESLRALKNGIEIFARTTEADIPRDLI
jgi:putative CocE/NonD family hydrolase